MPRSARPEEAKATGGSRGRIVARGATQDRAAAESAPWGAPRGLDSREGSESASWDRGYGTSRARPIGREPMVRVADSIRLRAHAARFDVAGLTCDALEPLAASRLDALLERPYEEFTAQDVGCALDVIERVGGSASLFAYFLPAVLRRPPYTDVVAAERFLLGLESAYGEATVSDWDAEIDAMLLRWLALRPVRGGDDPIDLYVSEAALRRHEIEAARRLPAQSRLRSCLGTDWRRSTGAPVYPRAALILLDRTPSKGVARLTSFERSDDANLHRAWVEMVVHAHGVGWRPRSREVVDWLDAPGRATFAEALMERSESDLAIGGAAAAILLSPRRAREFGRRAVTLLATLDASDSDRFVVTPIARRLLVGA